MASPGSAYNAAINGVRNDFNILSQAPPETLFHYTDLNGLKGIIDKRKIWATSVLYLNDSSELVYAIDLVEEVFRDRSAFFGLNGESLVDAFRMRMDFGDVPYVACLCTDGDLLSQWRAYGDGGAAVGFATGPAFDPLRPEVELRKVIYDPGDQQAFVQRIVDPYLQLATSTPLDVADAEVSRQLMLQELRYVSSSFKHDAFAEEKEWRLVCPVDQARAARAQELQLAISKGESLELNGQLLANLGSTFPTIHFRISPLGLGLTPYVKLPLDSLSFSMAIASVRLGPCRAPDRSLHSLTLYLKTRGISSPVSSILSSRVPLRG